LVQLIARVVRFNHMGRVVPETLERLDQVGPGFCGHTPAGYRRRQLSTPVGRFDFLCVDRANGSLVVVELKRVRPSDRVVGQIMRYMGYAGIELAAAGQAVEGLVIAHEVDDSLRYAVSALPAIRLTYQVVFSLTAVEVPKTTASATVV
jgi:hypothetical protein